MHYYLYEIRNVLSGKIYVGVHKAKSLNDGYMGSGKVIKRAIEKHGLENFTKAILETFDDSTAMYAREKEVVTDEFLAREDVYNLRRGGHGGFDHINKERLNVNRFFTGYNKSELGKVSAARGRNKAAADPKNRHKLSSDGSAFRGRHHTEKSKKQMGAKISAKCAGSQNSQAGTIWITNEVENKKITKDSVVAEGWRKGRVIKKTIPLKSNGSDTAL